MPKVINLMHVGSTDMKRAIACSNLLTPEQHDPECPVRHGASSDCVLPLVCCVFDDFQLLGESKAEIKDEPTTPTAVPRWQRDFVKTTSSTPIIGVDIHNPEGGCHCRRCEA